MRWGGEAIGREEMEHREKERPMAETKTSHPWAKRRERRYSSLRRPGS